MTTTQQTFAIVGADGVLVSDGRRFRLPEFQQLASWLNQMQTRQIDTLWLHPGAGWGWRDADIDGCDPWVVAGSGGGLVDGIEIGEPYWTATKPGTYGVRQLVQPRYEDRAPWREARDAESLRDALLAFRQVFGFDWWRGPGTNGTKLLRQLHSGAHATKLALPGDPPPPATDGRVSGSGHISWTRPLRDSERDWFLHAYDVNGQYLAACSSLPLGVGQWQRHSRPVLPEKPSAWLPGYYRVKLAEKPKNGPCPPMVDDDTAPWVTTPTLRLLREQKALFHVTDAYTWAESKRYLEPWYKFLREARTKLAHNPVALDCMKTMYRHPITWFASDAWDRTGDTLYRPDWYHLVTATARANVLRTVYRVGANYDVWPLAVGSDCLYYLSPSPDPIGPYVTVLCGAGPEPTDGLRLSPGLGHYKVKDAGVPVAEIAAYLRGRQWSLTALQEHLNVRAGRRAAREAVKA